MSTKVTIKHLTDPDTGDGYHLYEDLLDDPDRHGPALYLELDGVKFKCLAEGSRVIVRIPLEWAKELGLVPSNYEYDSTWIDELDGLG